MCKAPSMQAKHLINQHIGMRGHSFLTCSNSLAVGRIGAGGDFCSGASFLTFYYNDCFLLPPAFDIPYPRLRLSKPPYEITGEEPYLTVESAELVINVLDSKGCQAQEVSSPT